MYIQTGGGGGGLEDYAPTRSPFTARVHRDHHFCLIAVHGRKLELRAIDAAGHVFDSTELRK